MQNRYLYIRNLILITAVCSMAIYSFSIISNSSGYDRRYIDSDIPFVYKLNNTVPQNYIPSIEAGTETWDNVPSAYFEFQYGGTTPITTDEKDGTNLVFFDFQGINFTPGTNTIAYSRTWTSGNGSSYHAVESDMVWNARDYPPSPTGTGGQQDLQSVITHEFGHHLGLGHAGPAGGPPGVGPLIMPATMYGYSSSGDTTKRSLHIDDIAGVSAIYPSWIIEGIVYDGVTGLPFNGAKVSSDLVYGSITGQLIYDPNTGYYQRPGYYIDSMSTDQSGNYSAIALKQNFTLSVSYYGYQTETIPISFNAPGGIGQTQTILQDFTINLSPLSFISGSVIDSATSVSVVSRIKIYTTSDKPGVPGGIVADTTTDVNGNFSIALPSMEDFLIIAHPVAPYAEQRIRVNNLSQSGENVVFEVVPARILLVDDDGGADYEQFYISDLDSMNISFHWWDIQIDGLPTSEIRNRFAGKTIIWYTGDSNSSPLSQDEQNEIIGHLSNGGKLFLTGQDIAETGMGSTLCNILGIEFSQNSTLSIVKGVSGDNIGNNLVFILSGYGGASNQTSSDIIRVTDSSTTTTIFNYGTGSANPAGVRYVSSTDNSKAIFLGFGAESINDPVRRQTLLSRIFNFFNSPYTGVEDEEKDLKIPEKFELLHNYPNPFNPETTIAFSVAKRSNVSITVYNSLGQIIRTLLKKDLSAGNHKISWNGTDDSGRQVSSSVYYYQMISDAGFKQTRKLLLIK